MAIVIRYMYCLVFISRSSDLIQYGGIVTKANSAWDVELSAIRRAKVLPWRPGSLDTGWHIVGLDK